MAHMGAFTASEKFYNILCSWIILEENLEIILEYSFSDNSFFTLLNRVYKYMERLQA